MIVYKGVIKRCNTRIIDVIIGLSFLHLPLVCHKQYQDGHFHSTTHSVATTFGTGKLYQKKNDRFLPMSNLFKSKSKKSKLNPIFSC